MERKQAVGQAVKRFTILVRTASWSGLRKVALAMMPGILTLQLVCWSPITTVRVLTGDAAQCAISAGASSSS